MLYNVLTMVMGKYIIVKKKYREFIFYLNKIHVN